LFNPLETVDAVINIEHLFSFVKRQFSNRLHKFLDKLEHLCYFITILDYFEFLVIVKEAGMNSLRNYVVLGACLGVYYWPLWI